MSDPYRDAGGTPCPRCTMPLGTEDLYPEELVCLSGCGRWLPDSAAVKLFPTEWIVQRAEGNPFHATPRPFVRCLACSRIMDALYVGFVRTLTVNRCAGHGSWIDDPERDHFLEAYADCIREVRAAVAREVSNADLVEQLSRGQVEAFRGLLERIAVLEGRVAKLEKP